MIDLDLIGIGVGNPEHLTRQAIRALNRADVILVPKKGADKSDLAEVRLAICAEVLTNPATRIVTFDLPTRDPDMPYRGAVDDWHAAIAETWRATLRDALPEGGRAALMIWGDPSLYDSSLRIAALLGDMVRVAVVPGITAIQALAAAHAIPINTIAEPVTITTGRLLRQQGWPQGATSVVVMLDGNTAFTTLEPHGIEIWWSAYLGLPQEMNFAGRLAEVGAAIVAARAEARARHGWIMDIYLLRRFA